VDPQVTIMALAQAVAMMVAGAAPVVS